MANWAYTNYVIEGPKEILKKIHEAILHHDIEEGSSDDWEGNVLDTLGIQWERRQPDGSGYYMRGFIQEDTIDFDETENLLSFDAEEAWGATDFNEVLEKGIPEIKVYYYVEEPDDEVFATNDREGKYFPDRYYVDTCVGGEYASEYFETEDEMYEWLSNSTDGKVDSPEKIEEFNDKADEEHSEDFIHIFEVSIVY